jgi:hypothetical protein
LHLGQVPAEFGVIFAEDVVVNDDQRRSVLLRKRLELLLGHKRNRQTRL